MESVGTLIIGAGISGLASAAALSAKSDGDYLVLEADREIGGYCKTVRREGFVWDYSGHFFHFKHPDIETWLRERMTGQRILTVEKRSYISYKGALIDFPFQKNIHQLPKEEFIDCLYDLFFASEAEKSRDAAGEAAQAAQAASNFKEMLHARLGRSICEKFLIPYNEKLYACDLETLDRDAMGRFFPHADLHEILRNMKVADNRTYNSSFTYPEGGAIEYVRALASAVRPGAICLEEPLVALDVERKLATTPRRTIRYQRLISSVPFPSLLRLAGAGHETSPFSCASFSWNKVLVYNLGFDKKGPRAVHWIYYPDRRTVFYRVGFYDNIFDTDRLSVYIEIGYPHGAEVDAEATLPRVLNDLRREGVISDHRLVAQHSVVMDPAYVHITQPSLAAFRGYAAMLRTQGVFSIGRYGGWTYCSIEDNIVEARAVVAGFEAQ